MLIFRIFYYFLFFTPSISAISRTTAAVDLDLSSLTNNQRISQIIDKGLQCHVQKDYICAIKYYKDALLLQFDLGIVHNNLAFCYQEINDWKSAAYHHREAATWQYDSKSKATSLTHYVYAYSYADPTNIGSATVLAQGIRMLELARKMDPTNSDVLFRLGHFYAETGQSLLSLKSFTELVQHHPDSALGYLNIGNYYYRSNDFNNAEVWFLKLIQLCLKNANFETSNIEEGRRWIRYLNMAYANLGSTYRICDRLPPSLVAYTHAFRYTQFANDFMSLLYPMFNLTEPKSYFPSVFTVYRSIPTLSQIIASPAPYIPSGSDSWALSNIMAVNGLLCNWQYLELLEALINYSINLLIAGKFVIMADAKSEATVMDAYSYMLVRFSSLESSKFLARSSCVNFTPHMKYLSFDHQRGVEKNPRVLRVGYFSYDWRDHPMGRLTSRFVTHHNQSRVYSVSYSYGPSDFSEMRERIEKFSPLFVDLQKTTVPIASDAADIISSHQIDILVDLTALTFNGRFEIPAMRPAPLIINYLGYPGSGGCISYDYTIVDSITLPPEFSASFDEKLIYLDQSRVYQGNDMPFHVPLFCNGEKCSSNALFSLPGQPLSIPDFINDDTVLLCSFNANKKLEPISFQVWMNILRRVPNSVLIMMTLGPDPQAYIIREAIFQGINPSRLIFLPKINWSFHLRRSSGCDLVLDTFAYGAHTTSADMLWQAVPIVTLSAWSSGKMPSRVASSLVASLNSHTHHLITYTIQEYEDVVVRICYSPSIRYRMKSSLASNLLIASTFNKLSMQTSLEYAYTQAWEVRNILKKASKSLIDEQDPYHVVLPHIIGQSSSHSTSLKKNIMTNEFYERGLQLIQWLSCYGKIIKYYSNDDNMKMKYMKVLQDLIKDSDAEAVVDIQSSIRSIRYRLLLGGIENYYQKKLIIHGWNELLYDSCVYSYNCSIICLSLSFPENDLLSKTIENFKLMITQFDLSQYLPLPSSSSLSSIPDSHRQIYSNFLRLLHNSTNLFQLLQVLNSILYYFHSQNFFVSSSSSSPSPSPSSSSILVLFDRVRDYLFHIVGIPQQQQDNRHDHGDDFLHQIVFNNYHVLTFIPSSDQRNVLIEIIRLLQNSKSTRHHWDLYVPLQDTNLLNDEDIRQELVGFFELYILITNAFQRTNDMFAAMLSTILLTGNAESIIVYGSMLMYYDETDLGIQISLLGKQLKHRINYTPAKVPDDFYHTNKVRISIYCDEYGQSYWPKWNYTSLNNGLGGSEEAVLYLAEALAIQYPQSQIEIYLDTEHYHQVIVGNNTQIIHFLPYQQYSTTFPPNVFVAWRYFVSLGLVNQDYYNHSITRILWLHDLLEKSHLPGEISPLCDLILVPSVYHKQKLQPNFPDNFPIHILPHGLHDNLISEDSLPIRQPHVFTYASSPLRGLIFLLQGWYLIRERIPNAQLNIYYGYTDAVIASLKETLSPSNYQYLNESITYLLQQEGINYIGMVNNTVLLHAFATSGFLVYPSTYPETGCLTCLKAMAMGCIPITSRYTDSNLPYLMESYDLGPSQALIPDLTEEERRKWFQSYWIPSLVSAYQQDINPITRIRLNNHRIVMMRSIRKKYQWNTIARLFYQLTIEEIER